ncbi:sugar ABC transporter permease [soil metagenome]
MKLDHRQRVGLAFASPWLLGLLIFGVYPIAASMWFSLTRYNVIRPPQFVGLENYRLLFAHDPFFWKSLWNTLYLTVIGLPLQLAAAFLCAMMLNAPLRGRTIFRTIFFMPTMVPAVAGAVLWLWLLNPEYGLINGALGKIGLNGPGWLSDPSWSKPALILVTVWGMGGAMVIFLAGLQQIPASLYEAARVDGANGLQRFAHITIPSMSPVIFFNLVMGIIGSFQYFTNVYVMTATQDAGGRGAGGPEFSTLVYPLYLYQRAFVYFQMGYASAMAWVLFLIVAVILVIVFKTGGWVHYEEE